MEFFYFLKKESKEFGFNLILIGGFVGVVSAIMIFVLTTAASHAEAGEPQYIFLAMAVLCLIGYWMGKRYVLTRTTHIVEQVIEDIRIRISEKIRLADLQSFERIGAAPFLNVIAAHTVNISQAATAIINCISSVIMLVFAFGFIYLLSPTAFYLVGGTLGFLLLQFVSNRRRLVDMLKRSVAQENNFVGGFSDLLKGFKELKLNSKKNIDFFDSFLRPLGEKSKQHKIEIGLTINRSTLIANSSLFILLGTVIFLLPVLAPDDSTKIIPIAAVIVFIFSPIGEVISVYPFLTQAIGSINEIARVEKLMGSMFDERGVDDPSIVNKEIEFEEMECKGVEFDYLDSFGESSFSLKHVDFHLKKGEIVFVVGGNGCGKSTFLKVFTGLYPPISGKLTLNSKPVGDSNRMGYRNLFSPIFSDFHLFDRLYGIGPEKEDQIQSLLEQTELTEKTSIVDRRISNRELSSGQRKRLALVCSLVEDKPICVFDEWAAEQDPAYRKTFYEKILPDLKALGTTVLAVSHDDRYYHVADRVLKMEDGQFTEYNEHDL
jgi:putative pyoverdin transport system ATP-binding/permease protein